MKTTKLLPWIVLPLLVVWISINYLIGALKQPAWDHIAYGTNLSPAAQVSAPKLHWKNTGLVTFWFDDAWLSQYTIAFPILETAGYTASLSVPTRLIGFDDYLSWPQVKRLQFKGWEITSHSRTHTCAVDSMQKKDIESEIIGAEQDLATEGITAESYVTPCGADSPTMKELIKKNYLALRTTDSGSNALPLKNPYNITGYSIADSIPDEDIDRWIEEAKNSHSWIILIFHQISDENSEFSTTPQKFTGIVNAVKQSGLPVVSPIQVLEMVVDSPEGTHE